MIIFQGMGYGGELLDFAESTRPKSQVYVVSCRTDILPWYEKRGYKEISRCPAKSIIPPETLTRDGLEMIKLQKQYHGRIIQKVNFLSTIASGSGSYKISQFCYLRSHPYFHPFVFVFP